MEGTMKFYKPGEGRAIVLNGTHFQDYLDTTYKKLVDTFGEPTGNDGYKTDAEWDLVFEDGTVATIYNYKDGKNYNGDDGMDVENITDWHIGGYNKLAVERVTELLT
jgi:hypothetical protein